MGQDFHFAYDHARAQEEAAAALVQREELVVAGHAAAMVRQNFLQLVQMHTLRLEAIGHPHGRSTVVAHITV